MAELSTIKTIDDLTSERLTDVLRRNWSDVLPPHFRGVERLSWSRLDQGVLSRVHRVTVKYLLRDDELLETSEASLPTQWIVKLPREDLSLPWMFETEKVMYEIFAEALPHLNLPFTVPRLLYGTDDCLIVEGIENTVCLELMSGTPRDRMSFVTNALASLHGATWKSELFASHAQKLPHPPGIGHRLSPLLKEYLFPLQWRGAVENALVGECQNEMLEFIVDLCQQLEPRRLRDIHDIVHSHQLCCIHGDFNISNLLFPKEDGDGQKPALIDWAAGGFGNPMIDVAFFLVLNNCAADDSIPWLQQYYDKLIECNEELTNLLSFEEMLRLLRWALLYQWIILVAYDRMSRQLSEGDPNLIETKLKHFASVNRRAIHVMYTIGGFEIEELSILTETERKDARDFSMNASVSV